MSQRVAEQPQQAKPSAGREQAAQRWTVAALASLAAVLAAVVATLLGVAFTGAAAPSLLVDPGAFVRWGLPTVTALANLAMAVTIGALVVTCVALPVSARDPRLAKPAKPEDQRVRTKPEQATHPVSHTGRGDTRASGRPLGFAPAFTLVAASSAVWAVLTLLRAVLAYADVSGSPPGSEGFGSQLAYFLRHLDLGRGMLVTMIVAAVITMCAVGASTLRAAGLLTLLSFVGIIPPALSGHSASLGGHETAVTSLGLHLLGVVVWVGGLFAIVALRPALLRLSTGAKQPATRYLAAAAGHYSPLAFWSVVVIGASGAINAWLRIPTVSDLFTTTYGVLVLVKVAGLVALGAAGWWHRRRTLADLDAGRPGAFARLAFGEVVVMGAVVGVGAALAASAPPSGTARPQTLAQSITGYPMPPAPSIGHYLTIWQPDLLWVVICVLFAGLYIGGVVRLKRRNDSWPVNRTICWLIGIAVIFYVTNGPPAAYGRVTFSAHMLGHMTLSMVAPMLMVLGGPITLALRALHPRSDGSRGPREWLIAFTESGYMRFLCRPVVAAINFAFTLVIFYFTFLFEVALTTHVGHELMHIHFLFAGYLFAWILIGVDPGPHRPSYPLRLVLLFATMAFHSFFAIALMQSSTPLAATYFGGLGRTWGRTLLGEQTFGGGLTWGIGEIPTLALAIILAVQWSRSDDRDAKRADRQADRDGDADLRAYNHMLAKIAELDRTGGSKEESNEAANEEAGDAARRSTS